MFRSLGFFKLSWVTRKAQRSAPVFTVEDGHQKNLGVAILHIINHVENPSSNHSCPGTVLLPD